MAMFTDIVSVVRNSPGLTKSQIREICRSQSDVFWNKVFDDTFNRLKKEGKIVNQGTRCYAPESLPTTSMKALRAKYSTRHGSPSR